VHRWYGRIGCRYFIIDRTLRDVAHRFNCVLQSTYDDASQYAWKIIEIVDLIPFVRRSSVLYVSNKIEQPAAVVYRADDRGFAVPVYPGESLQDADLFTRFLADREPKSRFHAGAPEALIGWKVIRVRGEKKSLAGRYDGCSSALSVACSMSNQSGDDFRVECDDVQFDGREFVVKQGRVVVQ